MFFNSNLSITKTEVLTRVSLPLNIQLNFGGGTEAAVHCRVTLWPGEAAAGPIIEMLCGPSAQIEDTCRVKGTKF